MALAIVKGSVTVLDSVLVAEVRVVLDSVLVAEMRVVLDSVLVAEVRVVLDSVLVAEMRVVLTEGAKAALVPTTALKGDSLGRAGWDEQDSSARTHDRAMNARQKIPKSIFTEIPNIGDFIL